MNKNQALNFLIEFFLCKKQISEWNSGFSFFKLTYLPVSENHILQKKCMSIEICDENGMFKV
jgi:hypothetical protein